MQRLVLTRTPQDKREANTRLPYFKLSLAPEREGGEWIDVGVLWKSKSGKEGVYSGMTEEGVSIEFDKIAAEQARRNRKAASEGAALPPDTSPFGD